MSNRELIKKCLKKIKSENFDIETGLISEGWIDSFGLLKLIKILEEDVRIKIPLDEINVKNFDSIDAIQQLISQL